VPYITRQQRQQGAHGGGDNIAPLPPAWQALADRVLPVPDQSRYGPPGTTDSPRYRGDGTPWPRETDDKGDTET
jgi:hypothetical protein